MRNKVRIIWTYNFDETSIEKVLEDLEAVEWLSDDTISSVCEAFSSEIIWKLPHGFCVKRVYEFEKEVELYTLLLINMSTNKSFSEMLDTVDNWITWYKNSSVEKCGTIVNLDEYAEILNTIIEWLSREQKRRNNDERRDRAFNLMNDLRTLSDITVQAQIKFSEKSMRFLSDYKFDNIKSLNDAISYIKQNPDSLKWNNTKFNKFILHISNLEDFDARKTDFLIQFLKLDSVRSFTWINVNFIFLAKIIKRTKDRNKKAELKRQFNSLPWVQKDRREWNKDDSTDFWNTLFYESKMNGKGEAFWYTDSGLWRLSWKMWVVAAKWQPPK